MWRIIAYLTLGCFAFICCANENSVEKDGAPNPPGPCGHNGTKATGSFKLNTLNFTGECVWSIKPDKTNGTISLFMHFLYLDDKDTITLFRNEPDVKNDSLSIIEPLHVQNGSVPIFTNEKVLFIKLKGDPNATYVRKFEGYYQGQDCAFTIPTDLQIMHSPVYPKNFTGSIDCLFTYTKEPLDRITPSFLFEKFDMSFSDVSLSHTTKDGPYKENPRIDFFPISDTPMKIEVKMTAPTNDSFCLRMHMVDSLPSCHGYHRFDGTMKDFTVTSPADMLNNGTIFPECRWVFEHTEPSKFFGVEFKTLKLDSTMDIIAINDGASELSTPLAHVTSSSGNITDQLIRSTGPYLWLSFKPSTYASIMSATITVHEQGGHFRGSGNITMESGDIQDVVFQLEVEENQIVLLKFHDGESSFPLPATLSVYDGFDKTNLLATLHGNVWYPVISRSSKMMLVASQFKDGKFKAEFKGMPASCLHMGTYSNENYILSGNCNNTCLWVIPPQDQSNTNLLLNLQYLALGKDDAIKIRELDSAKTILGEVSSSLSHVPQLMVPANIGALVEITRAPCAKANTDVVLVGHSSYLPACGKDLTPPPQSEFQISSPLHPDTYPIYARCQWKVTTEKNNLLHLAFHSLQLADHHCVKITHDNKTEQYVGSDLRGDLFISGDAVVEFDSGNCTTTKGALALVSSEGFMLNGTVSDCGSVLSGKATGTFTVPANKTLCIWKVSIPETGHDASDVVNVISYTVSKNDDKGNYELQVYDGDSIRDSRIVNDTKSDIWSRTNNLIFVYKRIVTANASTILTIKYESISCNSTMQCDNKMCLHPDWRCNGINDCGDYTDERNCNAVPVPPITTLIGYSATSFWVTIIIMLALGAALGFGVPVCYQKYKNGQYRRFGDISIIE